VIFENNYKSQNESLLHFSLNGASRLDEILIVWPGGTSRTLSNYDVNATWTLFPPERLGDFDGNGVVNAAGHRCDDQLSG
jgi:hypothetical protein